MVYYNQVKREVNKMIKIKALLAINMDTVATTTTCYHCPLKWECKKWFYYDTMLIINCVLQQMKQSCLESMTLGKAMD